MVDSLKAKLDMIKLVSMPPGVSRQQIEDCEAMFYLGAAVMFKIFTQDFLDIDDEEKDAAIESLMEELEVWANTQITKARGFKL
jgi:hypothetical protein